jgi:uncharacterized membrane protein YczE
MNKLVKRIIMSVFGVALLFASGQNIEQILGSVGIGTIITAFFMGPLITFFNKNVAQKILAAGSK